MDICMSMKYMCDRKIHGQQRINESIAYLSVSADADDAFIIIRAQVCINFLKQHMIMAQIPPLGYSLNTVSVKMYL